MKKPLAGQVAIVTGASGGLGSVMVTELAAAGAAVVINYRGHAKEAKQLVADIEAGGGKALAIAGNVASPKDVAALFKASVKAFGGVHILVANAGVQKDAAFVDMTLSDWKTALEVDLTGQFLCMQAAARQFEKQGIKRSVSKAAGKIICISSVHQLIPWAGHVNYAAAKGGVEMLMRSAAQELAPKRIRINAIAPGAIRTPINQSVWGNPKKLKKLLQLIPYGRIGEPEDVAKAAVWLASDEADYITGTTLFIDGGMTLYPEFAHNG